MLKRLKLDDLQVESFATTVPQGRGTVVGMQESNDYDTQCFCSEDAKCSKPCIVESEATDYLACCG